MADEENQVSLLDETARNSSYRSNDSSTKFVGETETSIDAGLMNPYESNIDPTGNQARIKKIDKAF